MGKIPCAIIGSGNPDAGRRRVDVALDILKQRRGAAA